MIIDCHGHYTTAPSELGDYRENQKNALSKNKENQLKREKLEYLMIKLEKV